jgi:hypothetical protein
MSAYDWLHLETIGSLQIMPSMPVNYMSFVADPHLSLSPAFLFISRPSISHFFPHTPSAARYGGDSSEHCNL